MPGAHVDPGREGADARAASESEMELESAVEQQGILEEGGAEFHVVENGRHGSSMLLDTRTGHDMSASRELVINWISNAIDT